MNTSKHSSPSLFIRSLVASLLFVAAAFSARAADGQWTNDLSGAWSETTNWLDGVVADGAGSAATFTNDFASAVDVNLDSPRTLGGLNFGAGFFTITNNGVDANVLTLEGPSKPVLTVGAGLSATIARVEMAGTDGFIVDGGGTLNLSKDDLTDPFDGPASELGGPTNTISGGIVLTNGSTLQAAQGRNDLRVIDAIFGNIDSVTWYGNSTLNLVNDASTSPNYGFFHADLVVPANETGTLLIPGRWTGTGNTGGSGMDGTLTGAGTLNLQVRYVRGNMGGDWSGFTGTINVSSQDAGGEWRRGSGAGLPAAVVNMTGANNVNLVHYATPPVDPVPIGLLTSDVANAFVSGSPAGAITYRIGALQSNPADVATFQGIFSGNTAIIWEGAGTWILTGNSTHTGGTTISSGVLQVGNFGATGTLGTGPVANMTSLVLAHFGEVTLPNVITGPGSVSVEGFGATNILTGASTYTGPTTVSAATSKLVVGTASEATGPYTVADQASLGVLVTSDGDTLSVSSISFGSLTAFDFDLANFGNPDATVVTSTGAITLDGDVTVNVSGNPFQFSTGTITLLEYGSRSGAGNFVLGSLPASVTATLNDDTANNRVTLTINSVFDPTLRYVGDSAGVWDVDNPANQIWVEIGSGQTTNYYTGARVRFDDTATGTTDIEIATPVFPESVTVDNSTQDYTFSSSTFSGYISGTANLTKRGTGTLTFAYEGFDQDYTGVTRIEDGVVEIGNGGDSGTIGTGGIVNDGVLIVNRTNSLVSGSMPTVPGTVTGTGSVVVMGFGRTNSTVVFLPDGGSTYSGGTTVSNATIQMGNAAANSLLVDGTGLGIGPATFWGESQLDMFQSNTDGGDNGYDFNPIINVPAGQELYYNVPGRCREASTLMGAGTINVRVRWVRCYLVGDWSQFAGQINFYSAGGLTSLRLNDTLGMPLARVNLSDPDGLGNVVRLMNQGAGELLYPLGELSGEPATRIEGENGDGGDAPASTVWVVGGLGTDAEFQGTTADSVQGNAVHSFVKEGEGTWTLSGTNLHSGFTTVSNGVLALVGEAGLSNSVTVTAASPGVLDVSGRTDGTLYVGTETSAQTLGGDGAINGSVVLGASSTLTPGTSIGTLTVSNDVTLGGTTVMEVSSPSSSDELIAANITFGGTLVITNVGGISGNNTFQLFSGNLSGTFADVQLPALAGVTWDTSNLTVDGTISAVGPAVNPNPTDITVGVSNGNIELSWPETHIGWTVQSNAVGVADAGSWFNIEGSDSVNMLSLPFDTDMTNVFFRMVLP